MDKRKEVREAHSIHNRRSTYDAEMLERAIKTLAGHNLWSMKQIAKITGAKDAQVRKLVTKEERTGGRLNPESFDLIEEAFLMRDRGEWNEHLIHAIVAAGTSPYILSALLDVPPSTLKYYERKGRG